MRYWGRLATDEVGYATWYGEMVDEWEPPVELGLIELFTPFNYNWRNRYNLLTHVWEISPGILAGDERGWRGNTLAAADVPTLVAQDGNHKALGTYQDWQNYKNALRDWPEHPNFPDPAYRPVFINSLEVPEEPEEE